MAAPGLEEKRDEKRFFLAVSAPPGWSTVHIDIGSLASYKEGSTLCVVNQMTWMVQRKRKKRKKEKQTNKQKAATGKAQQQRCGGEEAGSARSVDARAAGCAGGELHSIAAGSQLQ
jgi:hypothetical protein